MKSVLERTETVSSELHRLELKELKLISIKVVTDHPDTILQNKESFKRK